MSHFKVFGMSVCDLDHIDKISFFHVNIADIGFNY